MTSRDGAPTGHDAGGGQADDGRGEPDAFIGEYEWLTELRRAREEGLVSPEDRVVLFNTGSGLKYLEAWRLATRRRETRGDGS